MNNDDDGVTTMNDGEGRSDVSDDKKTNPRSSRFHNTKQISLLKICVLSVCVENKKNHRKRVHIY